jgi:hypothetical protein
MPRDALVGPQGASHPHFGVPPAPMQLEGVPAARPLCPLASVCAAPGAPLCMIPSTRHGRGRHLDLDCCRTARIGAGTGSDATSDAATSGNNRGENRVP